MSNQDLRNLYENVRHGDNYVAPRRVGELYESIATEDKTNIHGQGTGMSPGSQATQFKPTASLQGGNPGMRFTSDDEYVEIMVNKNEYGYKPGKYFISVDALHNFAVSKKDQLNVYRRVQFALEGKGYRKSDFTKGHFGGLVHSILGTGDQGSQFINYIENKENQLSLAENPVGNVMQVAASKGADTRAIVSLMDSKWTDSKGSNIGPGEIALALLFKDVSNKIEGTTSNKGGDLSIAVNGVGGEIADLEVKGQGGRFGQQSGRGGVKANGLNVIYSILSKQLPEYKEQIHKKMQLNASNQNLVTMLSDTFNFIQQIGGDNAANSFHNQVIENLMKPAYWEIDYSGSKGVNLPALLRSSYSDPVMLKKTLVKFVTYHYINEHSYNFLLFIDKESGDYAMMINQPGANNDIGKCIDAGLLTTKGVKAETGFSMSTFYPNMEYRFNQTTTA